MLLNDILTFDSNSAILNYQIIFIKLFNDIAV